MALNKMLKVIEFKTINTYNTLYTYTDSQF